MYVHKIPDGDEDILKITHTSTDKFGVRYINNFINREGKVFYCLVEAPNMETIKKYHEKFNIKPD
ncbi:MAG: DUF4242 domain-containing protein [Nitrososphaeraceae archaeon]|nr:DUF4242 domain-containing protein [Nitrososphaeraceae archaeon]